jgi:putative transposase
MLVRGPFLEREIEKDASDKVHSRADHRLREAEVRLAQGDTLPEVCRGLAISEQTFYRWRKEFGGLKLSQAPRLKGFERENVLLRRLVADLSLANQQLKDQAGKDV